MKFAYFAGLSGKLFVAAGVCAGMLAAARPASADSFNVQFFSVTPSTSPSSDFHAQNVPTGTLSTNYVQGSLSGGLPVYNPGHNNLSGTVTAPNDVTGGGVIEWWTAGVHGVDTVVSTGSTTGFVVSGDPTNPTNMFPPNSGGTNNNNAEETAILTENFSLGSAQTLTFNIAADDDAFIFIDNTYVGGLGGIHGIGNTLTSFTSGSIGAGSHTLTIFYADQDQVAASLALTDNIPSQTPEPGSLALLGTGVLGLAGTLRRRMKR